MKISKSRFIACDLCPKMGWLDKYHPEFGERSDKSNDLLSAGTDVGNLAKGIFGPYVEIKLEENKRLMIEETKEQMAKGAKVIAEASFSYNDCFCQIDLLKMEEDGVSIYEVKSSGHVKEYQKSDMAFQYYVLTGLEYRVKRICCIHINTKYIREESLDVSQFFVIKDLTTEVSELAKSIEYRIQKAKKTLESSKEPEASLNIHCHEPFDCPYFKYCSKHLPSPNIFDVAGVTFKKKVDLYEKGFVSFTDLLCRYTALTGRQRMQIEFELMDKEPYIELGKIKRFLNGLSYPIYFLDFESYQQTIPLWEEISPYGQIPFQYSLHYLKRKGGKLWHKEFLAKEGEDPRRALAQQLCKDIPMNVCVLAYNMSFERMVLKDLAEFCPEYYIHLMNIRDNMRDLMVPFQKSMYYKREMQGSYSIKYVLPALFPDDPTLDYHNLEGIQNGSMAMNVFSILPTLSKEEREYYRERLLRYCELDTFAMVKIFYHLEELCANKEKE